MKSLKVCLICLFLLLSVGVARSDYTNKSKIYIQLENIVEDGSGLATIELSSDNQNWNIVWKSGDVEDFIFPWELTKEGINCIYVKISDKAGNIRILGKDGTGSVCIIRDTIPPNGTVFILFELR